MQADEFILVNASATDPSNPRVGSGRPPLSLAAYAATLDPAQRPIVETVGWEAFQAEYETEMAWDKEPWLTQRSLMRQNEESHKPVMLSTTVAFCFGFHALCCGNCPVPVTDPRLLLVHLHRLDYNFTKARHQRRAKDKWNPKDVERGYSAHQLVVEGQAFDDFYYHCATLSNTTTPIDEWIRHII